MKAIILAAGMGKRLGKYTANQPKGMLNFLGQSLLERQVKTLRLCGITDITVITGYKGEKIKINGVRCHHHKNFEQTNMVGTLFSDQNNLTGDILISYSDIVYEKSVVQKAIIDSSDIGVVVDEDYWDYWQDRLDHPENDLESLVIDKKGKITELGFPIKEKKDRSKTKVRYVGLIRLSPHGTKILRQVYKQEKSKYDQIDTPWLNSTSFKQGYMTSLLQAVINSGYTVKPITIKRGWLEFDTVEDYEKSIVWVKTGKLKKFINLNN